MAQASEFEDFESNFDKVNWIDTPTWANKKPYDETPYLILPALKFNLVLGDTEPDLMVFVKKNGEQFGDPITLPNLEDYTITIKIFDKTNKLVTTGPMTINDLNSGQIKYSFTSFDFMESGTYYYTIQFLKDDRVFTLPASNVKHLIIVR